MTKNYYFTFGYISDDLESLKKILKFDLQVNFVPDDDLEKDQLILSESEYTNDKLDNLYVVKYKAPTFSTEISKYKDTSFLIGCSVTSGDSMKRQNNVENILRSLLTDDNMRLLEVDITKD